MKTRNLMIVLSILFIFGAFGVPGAQEKAANLETSSVMVGEPAGQDAAIKMLRSIIELKKSLNSRIVEKKALLAKSNSETQKTYLLAELKKLDKAMASANIDFEQIATGVEIGLFAEKNQSILIGKESCSPWQSRE